MKRKNEPRGESLGSEDTPSTDGSETVGSLVEFIEHDDGKAMSGPAPPSVKAAHRDAKRRRKTHVLPEEVINLVTSDSESDECDPQKFVELKYRSTLSDTMRLDKRIRELQREVKMNEALLHDLDVEMRVLAREKMQKFTRPEAVSAALAVSHRGKTIVLPDTLPADVNDLPKEFTRTKTYRVIRESCSPIEISDDEATELVYTQE